MNPHIDLDLGELIRQVRRDKSTYAILARQQLCPTMSTMREILSKILATTRLISSGQLSLPQSRSMALQVERLVQIGLERKAACHSQPSVAQKSASAVSATRPDRQNDELSALSKRELEILTSLATGHSVHEVAALLGRSPKTVNNHRTNILHKLKLRNSAQLARFAIRNKLIEP